MRCGSGSFTRSRMAMILALRALASSLVWVSSTSSICSPQVMTGLSAVIGSWKIIDMRVQRSWRRRSSEAARMFSPSSRISPLVGFSALASRPITVKAITDLPEPDSPTRQTISPGLTVKLTFSTACARSAPLGRATERLRTSRTGFLSGIYSTVIPTEARRAEWRDLFILLSNAKRRPSTSLRSARGDGKRSYFFTHLGIERVAQPVAHDVDGEDGEGEEDARVQDVVREDPEQRAALGHDVAPARRLGRDADAEEAQDRLDDDRGGGGEGALHDQRRH